MENELKNDNSKLTWRQRLMYPILRWLFYHVYIGRGKYSFFKDWLLESGYLDCDGPFFNGYSSGADQLMDFSDYLIRHGDDMEELEKRLQNGVDQLSRDIIRRYITMYQLIRRRKFFLSQTESIETFLSVAEKESKQKWESAAQEVHDRYDFLGHMTPDLVHMTSDYGLKLFPEHSVDLKGKDVIDGGGFVGDSAMVFTEYSPKQVYLFEPARDIQSIIKRIIETNGKTKKITTIPLALGRRKGEAKFLSHGELDAAAKITSEKEGTYSVKVVSIDEFVAENKLNPGLIKLDVEGAEYEVILGAEETIRRFRPLLVISLYHRGRDFFEIKPLIESWNLNYKMEFRQSTYQNLLAEVCLLACQ